MWFQRYRGLKMWTDGRRTTDDGRNAVTIAHREQSSGELKRGDNSSTDDGRVMVLGNQPSTIGKHLM